MNARDREGVAMIRRLADLEERLQRGYRIAGDALGTSETAVREIVALEIAVRRDLRPEELAARDVGKATNGV